MGGWTNDAPDTHCWRGNWEVEPPSLPDLAWVHAVELAPIRSEDEDENIFEGCEC